MPPFNILCPLSPKFNRQINSNLHFLFLGDIFELVVDKHTNEKTPKYFWKPINGHLKKVIPGWNGICWGFGFDGIPYVRCEEYQPMESLESHVIYENQRWNPVEGFTARYVIVLFLW